LAGNLIATLAVPSITAGLTTFGWALDAEVDFLSATSCEVTLTLKWHTVGAPDGSATWFAVTTTTGLVTNVSNKNLSLSFPWGSVPAGTAFSCAVARFGKKA
jgi:hypothetical protein